MHYFVTCLPNRIATLLYIKNMTECTNHRPWDTETPSHKISHDEYYEKRSTIGKIQHKLEHEASTHLAYTNHDRPKRGNDIS